jgi:hypothetical protein
MKNHVKKPLMYTLFWLLAFCATKENFKATFPQEITSMSLERWTGGRRETGSGTIISIEFKNPLEKSIHLKKIYFENLETEIVQETEIKYRASFYVNALYREPQSSNTTTKHFRLKDNEAVIEYQKNNKTYYYKCSNIKEIPMIMYQ